MNLGVRLYLDTRIAARIFDILPQEARARFGRKLLVEAAATNPFNPEIWYRLASSASEAKDVVSLVQSIRKHDIICRKLGLNGSRVGWG